MNLYTAIVTRPQDVVKKKKLTRRACHARPCIIPISCFTSGVFLVNLLSLSTARAASTCPNVLDPHSGVMFHLIIVITQFWVIWAGRTADRFCTQSVLESGNISGLRNEVRDGEEVWVSQRGSRKICERQSGLTSRKSLTGSGSNWLDRCRRLGTAFSANRGLSGWAHSPSPIHCPRTTYRPPPISLLFPH